MDLDPESKFLRRGWRVRCKDTNNSLLRCISSVGSDALHNIITFVVTK